VQLARKLRYRLKLTSLTAAACILLLITLQMRGANRFSVPLSVLAGGVLLLLFFWQQRLARRLFVTDRIRMETRYRELSEEFQGLLDGIPDSLLLLSPEARVVWSNAGTSQLVGMESELLSGRLCRELWCGDACDEGACPGRRSLASGRSESAKMRTPNGRIWGVKTFPLKGNDGSIRGIIRWSSDITDRVRMEEDAMRSSHLAALGELAAGVAHEINNPNGLILLNSASLLESFQDALPILEEYHYSQGDFPLGGIPFSRMRQEIPHLFSEMADGARRIRRIVDDLKNFVRQDPNEYAEKVDLNRSVSAAARLSASTVKKSTDRFSLHLEKDLPPLLGNRQRLEQVIVNLLLNACQALADPGKEIVLQTGLDAASHRLVLEVIDQGIGIDPEAMPHITDPFFTTRRQSGGTGLGLSVSARIIKEHGGSLHFDSQPGRGTKVTVYLPGLLEDQIG
jgi:signal transduction histidine kinase